MDPPLNMRLQIGRALLFSLVLNAPSIGSFVRWGSEVSWLFTDIDEIYYLPRAIYLGNGQSPSGFYLEHRGSISLWQVLLDEPYSLPEIAFGWLGAVLGLSPLMLGLALDLVSGALVYCLLSRALAWLGFGLLAAEVGTIGFLMVPWIFSLDQFYRIQWPGISHVVSSYIGKTSGLPIQRSVSTQFSYVLYAIYLGCLLRSFREHPHNKRWFLATGITSGLLIYIYFFAWGASVVFAICAGCMFGLLRNSTVRFGWDGMLRGLAYFLWGQIIALPGFYVLLFGVGLHRSLPTPELRHYWYVSPEVLIQLTVLLLFIAARRAQFWRVSDNSRFSLVLWCSALTSQMVLMNSQPLLAQFLTPFRFVQLYLQPLCAGIALSLITAQCVSRFGIGKYTRACVAIFIFSCSYGRIKGFVDNSIFSKEPSQLDQLASAIYKHTSEQSVIVAATTTEKFEASPTHYSWRALPNVLNAVTGRAVLHQNWVLPANVPEHENLERELLLGWIYTGTPQLLMPCVHEIAFPGDIFELTWTGHLVARREMCRQSSNLLGQKIDMCQLLRRYSIDYVVDEELLKFDFPPEHLSEMYHLVWDSKDKAVRLYSFDRKRALTQLCANH